MVIFNIDFCGGGCYNQGMKKHNLYRGFTIIEVVLVLAIAGLIFLMVFLGLPALQRSQRDTARKSWSSTLIANLENARANNKGSIPSFGLAKNQTGYYNLKRDKDKEIIKYIPESSEIEDVQVLNRFSGGGGSGYGSIFFMNLPVRSNEAYIILGGQCESQSVNSNSGNWSKWSEEGTTGYGFREGSFNSVAVLMSLESVKSQDKNQNRYPNYCIDSMMLKHSRDDF